jgi:hypothetical protein
MDFIGGRDNGLWDIVIARGETAHGEDRGVFYRSHLG